MIPTNVMSFINKIVAADSGASDENESSMRGLLRNTLINAQDMVTSGSRRNSNSPLSDSNNPIAPLDDSKSASSTTNTSEKSTPSSKEQTGRRAGSCRVCLKNFKPEDYSRICFGCKMKVCEDCASYSKQSENEDESLWSCSVCRRKQQSIQQLIVAQDSTDSLLDIPIVDTLQRRHSDLKISSKTNSNMQLGSGLAPPRSPELRRHSDVSPASLKELEKALLKVASDKREEVRWERELEWRQKQQRNSRSPSLCRANQQQQSPQSQAQAEMQRQSQPQPNRTSLAGNTTCAYDRRPSANEGVPVRDRDRRTEDQHDPNDQRRSTGSPKPIPNALRTRRKSQVPKQHSYDEEIKNLKKSNSNMLESNAGIPRRASAYDVYQKRGSDAGSLNPNKNEMIPGRRSSFRTPSANDKEDPTLIDSRRRSSCRGQIGGTSDESFASHRQPGKPKPMTDLSGLNDPNPSLDYNDEERRARRRGSQLPDINAIKAGLLGNHRSSLASGPGVSSSMAESAKSDLRRQSSLTGEDIRIVIDDVDQLDLDQTCITDVTPVRRVVLRRDPTERIHKTRGFGMRVVGGKPGPDGTLYTYIVWTTPGGPAERAKLRKGDKILEICGINVMNLSFDEVTNIMDRTGDMIDMIVETQGVQRMSDPSDTLINQPRKKSPDCADPHESVISPTRRRLPKTPLELQEMVISASQEQNKDKDSKSEPQISRLQVEFWCKEKKSVLVVSILAADNLPLRDDYYFGGCQPEAFIRLRLIPSADNDPVLFSDVAEPNQNPIWNTTLELRAESGNVLEKALEVTIWDQRPDGEQLFIGEVIIPEIDLTIDTPVWYRIDFPEAPGTRKPNQYFPDSPTPSLDGTQRSLSEDRDSELDVTEGAYGLLHPDHAYLAGSRRGSSQSEQLEVEPYQLNRDFSRSLPGSRRSSFQSSQNPDKDIPPITYSSKGRRRSSCTPRPDPDEILRNLKAVKGELLGRSMSICSGDWRARRKSSDRRKESKDSVPELAEPSTEHQDDDDEASGDWKLGPFQLEPRFNTFSRGGNIELSLELCITKGQLAVKVCSARGLTPTDNPPDTYVKMYLRDNDRLLLKRKTAIAKKSCTPEFNQTIKYPVRDVSDRSLVVMLWERQKGFEHNQGLGSAEIRVDTLKLSDHVIGWYPLFPIQKIGSESNDSP